MAQSYLMVLVFAYLLGSIPVGFLAGRWWKGIDIREHGSGNIGSTNVLRLFGPLAAVLVLAADVAKGSGGVWIGRTMAGGETAAAFGGLAAIIGHVFPLFLGFRGGRGVATALGTALVLAPVPSAVALLLFILIVALTRYVSLGSMTGTAALLVTSMVTGSSLPAVSLFSLATIFIFWRHVPNIKRLLAGTENRLGSRSNPKARGGTHGP
ncbi:MAG: glycerol-3-phosphate 1-O-acyltransferase PlsY [Firmicutes bacterium]|nr:glycerol-3-phosphate 1-O-acyltransferase PlsY [Bacillota bacterium]